MKQVNLPITEADKRDLKAGEYIYLTGTLYTMRDAAHKRLIGLMDENKPLPIDVNNACIYYTGPTPKKNGRIGAIGPTTAYRMDAFMHRLPELNCTIGKGPRSQEVFALAKNNHILYLMAIGGIGAKLSLAVKSMDLVNTNE